MDAGLITNPKDLERMTGELESLERRISTLEDEELEVMERLEAAQGMLSSVNDRIGAADTRLAELAAARDARFAEIDAELAELATRRGPAVEGLPADLLALYEKLRESKGGLAVSHLTQRRCGGSRILVRTSESGL